MGSNYGTSLGRVVRELRRRRGWKQIDLARHIGVTQATISRWENGEQDPDSKHFLKLADLSGDDVFHAGVSGVHLISQIFILGEAHCNVWTDNVWYGQFERFAIELPSHPKHAGIQLFAVYLRDDSMNQFYNNGSILLCKALELDANAPTSGARILVEERDAVGIQRLYVRELVVMPDGSRWLWPRSTDPDYQVPTAVSEHGNMTLKARVVGYIQYD